MSLTEYSLSPATLARFTLVFCVLSLLFIGALANAQEAPAPSCPAGYELSGSECVATGPVNACPAGFALDSEDNVCKPTQQDPSCSEGSTLDETSGMCEFEPVPVGDPACPDGGDFVGGDTNQCMKFGEDPNDPEFLTFYDPTCVEGTFHAPSDKCVTTEEPVSACPTGFTFDSGTQKCNSDAEDVAPSCPEGTEGTIEGDQCNPSPVTPSCPEGYAFSENQCVENPAPENQENNENSGGSASNSGGGGGGGGGGSYVPPVVATTTATTSPQVLGTATSCFQFTRTLMRGMSGDDVTELQKILIAKGHLVIAAPTSHFGPMTQAGVVAFQAATGLEQTGIVDVKTRALLNVCPVEVTNPNAALILELYKKLALLLEQIKALKAARGVL